MSTLDFKHRLFSPLSLVALLLFVVSCSTQQDYYVYELQDVDVERPGAVKTKQKTPQEFIAIAYADLFGRSISPTELEQVNITYLAYGDQQHTEQLLIRNFLNDGNAQVPSMEEMRNDPEGFVQETYERFYNREPNEFELWKWQDLLENDSSLSPELIYFAFMTSEEYLYY